MSSVVSGSARAAETNLVRAPRKVIEFAVFTLRDEVFTGGRFN